MLEHGIRREEVRGAKLGGLVSQRAVGGAIDLARVPLVFDRLTEVRKLIRTLYAVPADVPAETRHRVVAEQLRVQTDKLRHLLVAGLHAAGIAVERARPVEVVLVNEQRVGVAG